MINETLSKPPPIEKDPLQTSPSMGRRPPPNLPLSGEAFLFFHFLIFLKGGLSKKTIKTLVCVAMLLQASVYRHRAKPCLSLGLTIALPDTYRQALGFATQTRKTKKTFFASNARFSGLGNAPQGQKAASPGQHPGFALQWVGAP